MIINMLSIINDINPCKYYYIFINRGSNLRKSFGLFNKKINKMITFIKKCFTFIPTQLLVTLSMANNIKANNNTSLV